MGEQYATQEPAATYQGYSYAQPTTTYAQPQYQYAQPQATYAYAQPQYQYEQYPSVMTTPSMVAQPQFAPAGVAYGTPQSGVQDAHAAHGKTTRDATVMGGKPKKKS